MKFGTIKSQPLDDSPTQIDVLRNGIVVKRLQHIKEEQMVANKTEETSAYLKFSDDLNKKRDSGMLLILKDDPSTIPSFSIKFPKTNIDGRYFIIKQWTELL